MTGLCNSFHSVVCLKVACITFNHVSFAKASHVAKPAINGVGIYSPLKGGDNRYFEQFTKSFESQHESFVLNSLDGWELWQVSGQEDMVWFKIKSGWF